MTKFFKGIGKGILYVLGFPFLIAGLALATVISIFIFFFQFGKLIFLFFTGRNLFSDLDEDLKAKAILQRDSIIEEKTESTLDLYPSNAPVYGSGYSSPVVEKKEEQDSEMTDETENKEESLFGEEDKLDD